MQQYEKLSRAEFGKLLPDISLTNQSGLLKEMSPQKKEMFRNQTWDRAGYRDVGGSWEFLFVSFAMLSVDTSNAVNTQSWSISKMERIPIDFIYSTEIRWKL